MLTSYFPSFRGALAIATHPRNITSAVRRTEPKRKGERERRKERKDELLLQKREEVKRMKALKLKELKGKLERIGKEGGLDALGPEALEQLDLDADWDEGTHDQRMQEIFAGMEGDEAAEGGKIEKPEWDDDIDISDIVHSKSSSSKKDKKKAKKKEKKKAESGNADGIDVDAMDADILPEDGYDDDEEWDGTEDMRKRVLDTYIENTLSQLDFTDLVGTSRDAGGPIQTRFRYTNVAPATYGLTPTEILLADDADLNTYVGLKKLAPYRRDGKMRGHGELRDPKKQEALRALRGKVQERAVRNGFVRGGEAAEREEEGKKGKKRMGKKERMKMKMVEEPTGEGTSIDAKDDSKSTILDASGKRSIEDDVDGASGDGQRASKKRKRKHKSSKADAVE